MVRTVLPTVALLLLATLTLAACGGEDADLLPGRTAGEINANLDAVRQLSDEGDCVGAESAALQVSEQVEAIEGIDPRLKRALSDGAERLREVVGECEEDEGEEEAPLEGEEEEFGEGASETDEGRTPGPRNRGERAEPENSGKAKGQEKGQGPPGKGKPEGGEEPKAPVTPEEPSTEGGGEPPSGGLEPSTPVEGAPE
jgi:hypothetical protein